MTIATQIAALQQDKSDIASAITNKGGTVTAGDGFDDFATDIASIPAGGGDTITAANNTGSAISEGDKVWINKVAGDGFQLIAYASADSVSLTGVADENIANNSTGSVKTVLPVELSVSVTVDADNATINLE